MLEYHLSGARLALFTSAVELGFVFGTIVSAALGLAAFSQPSLRLANFRYLGHVWELYADWTWIGLILDARFQFNPNGDAAFWATSASFLAVGVAGAVGCISGGLVADRWSRTSFTARALAVSSTCAMGEGFLFGANPWLWFAVIGVS